MRLQLRYLCVIAFLLNIPSVFGQKKGITNPIIERLNNRNKQLPQEKVHLHFDQVFYNSGDTIRFATYIVNAAKNIPIDINSVLNVELIDINGKIQVSSRLHSKTGFGSGTLALPDSLSEGWYQIRAYSNWMRNFDPGFFFNTGIFIKNSSNLSSKIKLISTPQIVKTVADNANLKYSVVFYPEGGQLVDGLASRVAFKAVDSNGRSVAVHGILNDDAGENIGEFTSGHGGMGSFTIVPSFARIYSAKVFFSDGTEQAIKLPKIEKSGYVLTADNSNADTLFVKLQATANLLQKQKMVFIPMSNGIPLFYMETIFPDQTINIGIPKTKIPGGIVQLSLLNEMGRAVSERLIFNKYTEELQFNVKSAKSVYEKGELVELELTALDRVGKPVIGCFSLRMAYDKPNPTSLMAEATIFTGLLLCSDIKGYIEQPNYYFENVGQTKERELDNLLLTQGWRRHTWDDIYSNDQNDLTYTAENKLTLSGRILGGSKNTLLANIPVTLLAGKLGEGVLLDTLTDAAGKFKFSLPDTLGYLPLRVQVKPKKAASYEILLDQNSSIAANSSNILGNDSTSFIRVENLKNLNGVLGRTVDRKKEGFTFNGSNILKEVKVRNYNPKPKLTNSHSANLNGPGQADNIILPETLEKMPDLTSLDVLVSGVISLGYSGFQLSSLRGIGNVPKMLILVDGAEGLTDLREISPRDIESIEVLKNIAYSGIYGIRGSGGVLLITTKKGSSNLNPSNQKSANAIIIPAIFDPKVETYNQSYKVRQENEQFVDTVYWNSEIITDRTGVSKFHFNAPDRISDTIVTVEGVSINGSLGRKVIKLNFGK